jgi:hypothetical protein
MHAGERWAFPSLPARPLGLALERALDPDRPVDEECENLRTSSRSLREWVTGTRELVQFNTADKVLCALGLNWWEVWNEKTVSDPQQLENVRWAFTGECASPCPYEACACLTEGAEQLTLGESMAGKINPLEAPLPLGYVQALERAAFLRNNDPSVFSWPTIARVMRIYHGWDRHYNWWAGELLKSGQVKPLRETGHIQERLQALASA